MCRHKVVPYHIITYHTNICNMYIFFNELCLLYLKLYETINKQVININKLNFFVFADLASIG